jgi:two-component system, OmpR family, copper resistance phosphate regulon response regulator CusR
MNVLIVETAERVASFLSKGLRAHGYTVEWVSTGREALRRGLGSDISLMVLDLALPDLDGLDVLITLRKCGYAVPVLVLSTGGRVEDRVKALDLGADDCLVKPFALEEFLARVRANLRPRASGTTAGQLVTDGIRLDVLRREVSVGGRTVSLSAQEFYLLQAFLTHPGQVLSRQELLASAWKMEFDPHTNLIDVYLCYLRRKLGEQFIETVRGAGYRFRAGQNAEVTPGPRTSESG